MLAQREQAAATCPAEDDSAGARPVREALAVGELICPRDRGVAAEPQAPLLEAL